MCIRDRDNSISFVLLDGLIFAAAQIIPVNSSVANNIFSIDVYKRQDIFCPKTIELTWFPNKIITFGFTISISCFNKSRSVSYTHLLVYNF